VFKRIDVPRITHFTLMLTQGAWPEAAFGPGVLRVKRRSICAQLGRADQRRGGRRGTSGEGWPAPRHVCSLQ